MAKQLPVHTLVAYNTATSSENKIHDDTVAATLGFGGGLVPGVDVYAYLCQPAVANWGADFLAGSLVTTRFGSPVYDGERVEVRASVDDDGVLRAGVHTPTGPGRAASATLEARLGDESTVPPGVARAEQPAAADRPPASPASLAVDTVLGSFDWSIDAADHATYLGDVRDERSRTAELGLVHPGALLRLANSVLSETVRLGPWIHVGSTIHHRRPVEIGETIEVRGAVTDNREHKGHRFVDLDVVLVGTDGEARVWVEHTAIYEPRQLRAGATS
ncbi:MAG: hypothetical protein AAGA93_22375 [Actinomycetota bacterium]